MGQPLLCVRGEECARGFSMNVCVCVHMMVGGIGVHLRAPLGL